MLDKYEIHGSNDITSILIAKKFTLSAALLFAEELLSTWDDVHIRERTQGSDVFKIVARLSSKGLFI